MFLCAQNSINFSEMCVFLNFVDLKNATVHMKTVTFGFFTYTKNLTFDI